MRASPFAALVLVSTVTSAVRAQAPECGSLSGRAGRLCTAAVDATHAFHPLLGVLVSGGNPILGSGGPLGGPGQFSVTARVNGSKVVLPDLSYDGSGDTVPAGQKVFAPAPQLEAAVGVYGGLPSGLLAVDALGSALLLPTSVFDDFSVQAGARHVGDVALGLGYGVRVGILRDAGPMPGVSVSVMRRDIPTISYGSVSAGDEFQYSVDLHATNLRLVVGKELGVLGVAAGVGWDKYTGKALIEVRNPSLFQGPGQVPVRLESSRATIFLDAGLDLSVLKLVGEAGYQAGKDQKLTTNFEDFDPHKGKFYGGLGLRVGL